MSQMTTSQQLVVVLVYNIRIYSIWYNYIIYQLVVVCMYITCKCIRLFLPQQRMELKSVCMLISELL